MICLSNLTVETSLLPYGLLCPVAPLYIVWNAVNTDQWSDANPSAVEVNISIPGNPLGQSHSRTGVWN